ncbi:MAG: VCBS repeat-containing protein [Phycisphaerae bacterium]
MPVFSVGAQFDAATISDVEPADLDGDGLVDLAVAWYATDFQDMSANRRAVSILLGTGSPEFAPGPVLELYQPNFEFPEKSIFRNGTSELAVGDFDGDGDPDLAALPFFGDELWFIENLGGGAFAQYLYFIFDINSGGNEITPPKAAAADFAGVGRDVLVYVVDPILYVDQVPIHFWRGTQLSDMRRVRWEGNGGPFVQWTRSLAVDDFDGDGRPDVAFSGSDSPPLEEHPAIVLWHNLNLSTKRFDVSTFTPSFLCSDIVAFRPPQACRAGLLTLDLNGLVAEHWAPSSCSGPPTLSLVAAEEGYVGSFNRGMAGATGDIDGDGDLDLVTRQRLTSLDDCGAIDVTRIAPDGAALDRVDPAPVLTCGYAESSANGILRPRNLAVADLFGNQRPEIVAAFDAEEAEGEAGANGTLRLALWSNSCPADVNADGQTNILDLGELLGAFGSCDGTPDFDAAVDLNHDGCADVDDLALILENFGCTCCVGTSHH